MSYENPTRLRIGMYGKFSGKDFRLIGRVVLGVTDDGETYYWNEFNLLATDGTVATLAYEEGERGGEWRMFTQFDPEYPMTAAEAATKRVGDQLNLTGTDVRVTLVDTSRVYRIEGQAPEGVERGDVAHYFNAEAGGLMQVVSWTGEEVEFFNGVNLAEDMVLAAFNLPSSPQPAPRRKIYSSLNQSDSGKYNSGLKFLVQVALVILVFAAIFGPSLARNNTYEVAPVKTRAAGQPPLTVGSLGKLNGNQYHLTAHAVTEVAEVGAKWERHEYELTDTVGRRAHLVCGWKPNDKEWILFTPLSPLLPPSTKECAAKKLGEPVNVDGVTGSIREIFLLTTRQTMGTAAGPWPGAQPAFGYLAKSEYNHLLVCWDSQTIRYENGKALPATEVAAAFGGACSH